MTALDNMNCRQCVTLKHQVGVTISVLTLVVATLVTTAHAQPPRSHRDCPAGHFLNASQLCQPMETVLSASGKLHWVSQPTGSDSNPGTKEQPFQTISRATQAVQPGDSVIVRAGTYRESIRPTRGGTDAAKRITYAAYTGEQVIISGADIANDGWVSAGNAWRHSWTQNLCANPDSSNPLHIFRREMVIANGVVLRAVATRAEVVPGTFYVEGTDTCAPVAIYLRLPGDAAPSGHTIELAKRDLLFSPLVPGSPGLECGQAATPGYFRLLGFTFRHAANRAQVGAVCAGSAGSLIEENMVEWTNGMGVSVSGRDHVFRGNTAADNGQMGWGGSMQHGLVEYNKTFRNNWKGYTRSWEAGGGKFVKTHNTTIRFHEAGDNDGPGIWFDIDNTNNRIENSLVYRNQVAGIVLELRTNHTIVRNNVLYANRTYTRKGVGMITQASMYNTIVHNTFYVNEGIGLWIMLDPERRAPDGNNQIFNNLFTNNCTVPNAADLCAEIDVQGENMAHIRSNRLDGNLYWRSTPHPSARLFYTNLLPSSPNFYWGDDLAQWRTYMNGEASTRIADPLLQNAARLDGWHLTARSPAIHQGVRLSMLVPSDADGRLRPTVGADVGADRLNFPTQANDKRKPKYKLRKAHNR